MPDCGGPPQFPSRYSQGFCNCEKCGGEIHLDVDHAMEFVGIRAAMDAQIIRGEEGINQFSLIKDLHLNLFAHLQDLLTTATLFHV